MKESNKLKEIKGAEGIVIHNGNIVLGMQKEKRWYTLEDGKKAVIIKTLGGQIEKEDEGSSRKALIREIFEEIKGITNDDIKVGNIPVFNKNVKMSDLNPFEKQSSLNMNADFYIVEIEKNKEILPNDLPALIEIPINKFLNLEFSVQYDLKILKEYIIKNDNLKIELPKYCALMVPEDLKMEKSYLKNI